MSGGNDTSGIAAALALEFAAANGSVDGAAAEQVEMFLAEEADKPSMISPSRVPKSATGRPLGSRNKTPEFIREMYLRKFPHPLLGAGELLARTPADLAREMQLYKYHEGKQVLNAVLDEHGRQKMVDGEPCWEPALATGEAFDSQVKTQIALFPYFGQKLPLAIEAKGSQRGLLVVGDLNVNLGVAGDGQLPLPDAIDVTPEKAGT